MASYKQPCVHCGTLIDRDSRFCPTCASSSPFGYLCPTCLRPVERTQAVCSGCARPLYIPCPHCKQQTFVGERCDCCGKPLMVRCTNKRCGVPQFFQNTRCTACVKKIKAKL